jgi:hypothetical protein
MTADQIFTPEDYTLFAEDESSLKLNVSVRMKEYQASSLLPAAILEKENKSLIESSMPIVDQMM